MHVSGVVELGKVGRAGAVVVGTPGHQRTMRIAERGPGGSHRGLVLLATAHEQDEDDSEDHQQHRAQARPAKRPEEPGSPLPREEHAALAALLGHLGSYCTKSFIWMSGMRMENAMKPTAAPMTTMIKGSSRLVIAWMRVSTCVS